MFDIAGARGAAALVLIVGIAVMPAGLRAQEADPASAGQNLDVATAEGPAEAEQPAEIGGAAEAEQPAGAAEAEQTGDLPLGPAEAEVPRSRSDTFLDGVDRAEGIADPAGRSRALTEAVAGLNGNDPETFGGFAGSGSRAFSREGRPDVVLSFSEGNWVNVDTGRNLHNMVLDGSPRRLSFDRETGAWDAQGYDGKPGLRERDMRRAERNLVSVADDITDPRWTNTEPLHSQARRQYEASIPFGRASLEGSVNSDLGSAMTIATAANGLMEARDDRRALDLYREALTLQKGALGEGDPTVQENQQVVKDLEAQIARDAGPVPGVRGRRQLVDVESVSRPVQPPRWLINDRVFKGFPSSR